MQATVSTSEKTSRMSLETDSNSAKKGRKTSYLSTLPPDVLCEILRHLSTTDLTHLSHTCRALHQAATSEEQFSHRLSQLHNQKGVHSWSIAYRRFCALRKGPSSISIRGIPGEHARLRHIVGAAGDTLLIYDGAKGRLVAFPAAWSKYVGFHMGSYCIMAGNAHIIVLHCEDDHLKSMERIDVHSGRQIGSTSVNSIQPVKVSSSFCRHRMRRSQVAMSAGPRGDHLIFVSDAGEAAVVRIEDGVVVRRQQLEGDMFSALVRGVDGGWWSGEGDGNCRVIGVLGRSGETIRVLDVLTGTVVVEVSADANEVIDVVLATDGRIAIRSIRRGRRAVVRVCYFQCDDGIGLEMRHDVGIAGEAFRTASCEFSLARAGDEVRILPMGTDSVGDANPDGRMCRVWCGDEFGHVDSLHGIRQVGESGYDWGFVSDDGSIAVACCRSIGLFAVFELNCGRCVTSFQCSEKVVELLTIGQRWIVAIGASGKAHEFHFNHFWGGVGGGCSDGERDEHYCDGSLLHRWADVFTE